MAEATTTKKATFPSVEWFEALKEIVNNDAGYKHHGTCDAEVGIKIPDLQKYFKLSFEAFGVEEIKECDEDEAENTDFWLEQSYAKWKEMIENIKANERADLNHTLNTLDIEDPNDLARSNDGYRRDAFYRFNQSFQHFFDISSQIETEFV